MNIPKYVWQWGEVCHVRSQFCFPQQWHKMQLLSASPGQPTLPIFSTVVFYLHHLTEPALNAFHPRLSLSDHLALTQMPTSLLSSAFTGLSSPHYISLHLCASFPVEKFPGCVAYNPESLFITPTGGFRNVWGRFLVWVGLIFLL